VKYIQWREILQVYALQQSEQGAMMKMRHYRKQFWYFPELGVFMKSHNRKVIFRKVSYFF
jgi:hypothetical protein